MKNNIYQMITNRILEQLDKGVIPWRKDWRDTAISHTTGKGYRGINALILDRPGEAEIGSAMVYSQLGMGTPEQLDNSTAYVQSWLQVLENDPRMIVSAANQAQRAADLILGEYTGEDE